MGHQIALAAAIAGYRVTCTDTSEEMRQKAAAFAGSYLPGRVAKEKMTPEAAEDARQNLTFTAGLDLAARDADLVIEAVTENLELKRELFARLDRICPPHTILATNSSYIVSSRLADATGRPSRVCNLHFFNPALVMKVVEVVKGPHVSDETVEAVTEVVRRMGKTPVLLHKEIYGFLVNRILAAQKKEALYLCDLGVASPEDIDAAVTGALGYPMGPFRLMDLTGIDLTYHVAMERFRETGDPAEKPSPVVVEKFVRKEWGRKTGQGFYDYGGD